MKKAIFVFIAVACLLCSCAREPDRQEATSGEAYFSAQEHAIEIPVVYGPSLSAILSELESAPAYFGTEEYVTEVPVVIAPSLSSELCKPAPSGIDE